MEKDAFKTTYSKNENTASKESNEWKRNGKAKESHQQKKDTQTDVPQMKTLKGMITQRLSW